MINIINPLQFITAFHRQKMHWLALKNMQDDYYLQQEDMRANRPAIARYMMAYVKRCFKNGAMDFDDLLLKFYELLTKIP